MQNVTFVVLPLLIFMYIAANGILLAISPLSWARSKWTAKGQYVYDEVAKQMDHGKAPYWRFAGLCMTILSFVASILIASWILYPR